MAEEKQILELELWFQRGDFEREKKIPISKMYIFTYGKESVFISGQQHCVSEI